MLSPGQYIYLSAKQIFNMSYNSDLCLNGVSGVEGRPNVSSYLVADQSF